MAGKVETRFTNPGFEKVLSDFDQLSKKEQQMVVDGSKLGNTLEGIGRKGKKAGTDADDGFKKFAAGLLSGVSASALLSKGLAGVRKEYERIVQLNKEGRQAGLTVAQAKANLIINNQAAFANNPQSLDRILKFSREQAPRLGGENAEARILQAFTTVRSVVGKEATDAQQREAMARSIAIARRDPTTDIAQSTIANLRLQRSLGIGSVQASNTASTFGEYAGADINKFIPELGRLSGITQAPGFKGDINDVLAFAGVISQKLNLSPEESRTMTGNLLGKMSLQAPRYKGKAIQFQSQNTLDQVVELFQRVNAGEFGNQTKKVLTDAGLRGGDAASVIGAITSDIPGLNKARQEIRRYNAANAPDLLSRSDRFYTPFDIQERHLRGGQAAVETALGVDPELSKRAQNVELYKQTRKRLGLPTSGIGGIDLFGLFDSDISQVLLNTGIVDTPEGARRLAAPSLTDVVPTLFGTEAQKKARAEYSQYGIETQFKISVDEWRTALKEQTETIQRSIEANRNQVTPGVD